MFTYLRNGGQITVTRRNSKQYGLKAKVGGHGSIVSEAKKLLK